MASQGLTLTFSHLPSTASKRQEKKTFLAPLSPCPNFSIFALWHRNQTTCLIPFYKIMQSAKVTSVGVFKIIAFIWPSFLSTIGSHAPLQNVTQPKTAVFSMSDQLCRTSRLFSPLYLQPPPFWIVFDATETLVNCQHANDMSIKRAKRWIIQAWNWRVVGDGGELLPQLFIATCRWNHTKQDPVPKLYVY